MSTLCDSYGLPEDFPDRSHRHGDAKAASHCERLENVMASDIAGSNGDAGTWGFIPYIQSHEFEALALACLQSLLDLYDADCQRAGVARLQADVSGRPPEDINNSPRTSPSHRLLSLTPGYRKAVEGLDAIELAGLRAVRFLCPRFDNWRTHLEALSQAQD